MCYHLWFFLLLSTRVPRAKYYFLAGRGSLSSRLPPAWWWLWPRWSATAPGLRSARWPAACPPPGTAGSSPYTPPRHSGHRDTCMNYNMFYFKVCFDFIKEFQGAKQDLWCHEVRFLSNDMYDVGGLGQTLQHTSFMFTVKQHIHCKRFTSLQIYLSHD